MAGHQSPPTDSGRPEKSYRASSAGACERECPCLSLAKVAPLYSRDGAVRKRKAGWLAPGALRFFFAASASSGPPALAASSFLQTITPESACLRAREDEPAARSARRAVGRSGAT